MLQNYPIKRCLAILLVEIKGIEHIHHFGSPRNQYDGAIASLCGARYLLSHILLVVRMLLDEADDGRLLARALCLHDKRGGANAIYDPCGVVSHGH